MPLSRVMRTIAIVLAAVAVQASAGLSVRLSADGDKLWRCVLDDTQTPMTYTSLLDNGYWIGIDASPQPVAALCATDGKLHVFRSDGAYLILDAESGQSQMGEIWPKEYQNLQALAACAVKNTGPVSTLFLLLGPEQTPATPATPASPASPDTPDTPDTPTIPADNASEAASNTEQPQAAQAQNNDTSETSPGLILLKKEGRKWSSSPMELQYDYSPADRFHMVPDGNDGNVIVLACTTEGWPKTVFGVSGQKSLESSQLIWLGTDYRIGGITSTGEDILLYGGNESSGAWLTRMGVRFEADQLIANFADAIPLNLKDKEVDLSPKGGGAFVARGGAIATLIYPDSDKWMSATASISDGKVIETKELPLDVNNMDSQEKSENVIQVFILVLMAAIAAMVFSRTRDINGPFVLPPGIRPAFFLKRLIAAVVEMGPATMLGTRIFGLESEQATLRFERMVRMPQQSSPEDIKLIIMILCIYVGYCIITEAIWGSTPVKMLLGMKVCGRSGRKPSLKSILIRNIMKPLEIMTPLVVVFMLWPLFTRCGQRIGDMLAGVTVINRPFLIAGFSGKNPHEEPEDSDKQTEDEQSDKDADNKTKPSDNDGDTN